jgi:NADH dehydrogenase FAD-containing subunit
MISSRHPPTSPPTKSYLPPTIFKDDLKIWYPALAGKIRITLVEAPPSVLPMFSKQLIEYTESTFKKSKIEIPTKKEVKGGSVVLNRPNGSVAEVGCESVVWAAVSFGFFFMTTKRNFFIRCDGG